MNELTEQAKDGISKGGFDDSLTNLIGGIPQSSPTMSKEVEPEEEIEDKNKTPSEETPKGKTSDKDDPLEEEEESEEKEQEEPEEEEVEEEDEPNLIDELAAEFGDVDFGEDTEFETEGQAAKVYVKKLLESKGKEIGKTAIEGLFKQMPEVGALVEHLSQGYGLDSFLKEIQPEVYTPIDIEEASEDDKIGIIKRAYKMKGLDDDEIEDSIEVARDTNKLDARASSAQKFLEKKHNEEVEKIKQQEKEQNEANERRNQQVLKEVNTILDSGKLAGGSVILDKDKSKVLKDFVFGQNKEGQSIRAKAWQDLDLDKKLLLDYLVATDFKDLKFGKDVTKSKITKNIKIKNAGGPRVKIDNPSGGGAGKRANGDAPFNVKNFFNDVNN